MNKGFTLFEVIVYLAIFSLMIVGVFLSTYQIIDSNSWIHEKIFSYLNTVFLIDSITQKTQNGLILSPSKNSTSSTISFEIDNSVEKIYVENDQFFLERDGETNPLTSKASRGASLLCSRFEISEILNCDVTYNSIKLSKSLWSEN